MLKKIFILTLTVVSLLSTMLVISFAYPANQIEGVDYVIQVGDTLSKVANRFYGDPFAYSSIVEATNAKAMVDDKYTVIDNYNRVEAGQIVFIPNVAVMQPTSRATQEATATASATASATPTPTATVSATLNSTTALTVGTVIVENAEINYFIEGTGPPCVVITEGALMANVISDNLKENFQFIFVNARMNVTNPGPIDQLTFKTFADDIEVVRQTLNLDKICVFGHSISGILALEYARIYPENTSHVIMHGTYPYLNSKFVEMTNLYWDLVATKDRKAQLDANWAKINNDELNALNSSERAIVSYIANGPKYWRNATYNATPLLTDTYWMVDVWQHISSVLMVDYDLAGDNPVQTPVFLAIGKFDYMLPYVVWNEDQQAKISNLSYNLFEESGHYPALEEPALFDEKILAWYETTIDN